MKRRIHWKWNLGLALAVLPLVGGQPEDSYSQPTNTAPAIESEAIPEGPPADPAAVAEPAIGEDELVDAPATPISTQRPLPPGVRPAAPVNDILKLVDSGVDESVLLTYVTNSPSAFQLDADQIIYLNDIGVPGTVVTAMIQRDQALKALSTNAVVAAAPPASATPAPAPPEAAPLPAPGEIAPQPDYTTSTYVAGADSTYAPFYDSLAPYGTWVNVNGYGPCWQPTVVYVNPTWTPYCDGGRWIYTDCGWYWLSGYSWGWAPFHYGRWFRHSHRGWCWQPGTTWGPSWVSWRYNSSYCGWAPLPPAARFTAGVGLTYHGQRVSASFGFGLGAGAYTFVPVSHFSDHHPRSYAVPHQHATQIYGQTTPSVTIAGHGSRIFNRGIPVSHVANATHTRIHRFSVREGSTPAPQGGRREHLEGRGGTVSGFRPRFSPPSGTQAPVHGRTQLGPNRSANPTPSPTRRTTDSATRRAEPLILRGPDRSRQTTGTGSSTFTQPSRGSSWFMMGKRDDNRSSFGGRTPASTPAPAQATTAPQQSQSSPPAPTQRPQSVATAQPNPRSQRVWSIPRTPESRARSERPAQVETPAAHSAPAQVPRNVWTSPSVPRQTHSFSRQMASPAPQASAPERRQSYSPPARSSAPEPRQSYSPPPRSSAPEPRQTYSPPARSAAPATPSQPSSGWPTHSRSSSPFGRNSR